MIQRFNSVLVVTAALVLLGPTAKADDPKELKTTKGKSIIVGNFVNARSDCSSNPGPDPLPALREKPSNGVIRMQILVTDVAATDGCPARKIPSLALIYTPNRDFVGIDSVQIEIDTGNNNITSLSYRILVQAPEDKL
jgi:hypothetical protein